MQQYKSSQKKQNNIFQDAFAINDDLLAIRPVPQGQVYDGLGAMAALVLIGFYAGKPVFRTTHTAAHELEETGKVRIYWPLLFPGIRLPECELGQMDVIFGTLLPKESFCGESDEEDENKVIFHDGKAGKSHAYDDDDQRQQQQIPSSNDNVDDSDPSWDLLHELNNKCAGILNIGEIASTMENRKT